MKSPFVPESVVIDTTVLTTVVGDVVSKNTFREAGVAAFPEASLTAAVTVTSPSAIPEQSSPASSHMVIVQSPLASTVIVSASETPP